MTRKAAANASRPADSGRADGARCRQIRCHGDGFALSPIRFVRFGRVVDLIPDDEATGASHSSAVDCVQSQTYAEFTWFQPFASLTQAARLNSLISGVRRPSQIRPLGATDRASRLSPRACAMTSSSIQVTKASVCSDAEERPLLGLQSAEERQGYWLSRMVSRRRLRLGRLRMRKSAIDSPVSVSTRLSSRTTVASRAAVCEDSAGGTPETAEASHAGEEFPESLRRVAQAEGVVQPHEVRIIPRSHRPSGHPCPHRSLRSCRSRAQQARRCSDAMVNPESLKRDTDEAVVMLDEKPRGE